MFQILHHHHYKLLVPSNGAFWPSCFHNTLEYVVSLRNTLEYSTFNASLVFVIHPSLMVGSELVCVLVLVSTTTIFRYDWANDCRYHHEFLLASYFHIGSLSTYHKLGNAVGWGIWLLLPCTPCWCSLFPYKGMIGLCHTWLSFLRCGRHIEISTGVTRVLVACLDQLCGAIPWFDRCQSIFASNSPSAVQDCLLSDRDNQIRSRSMLCVHRCYSWVPVSVTLVNRASCNPSGRRILETSAHPDVWGGLARYLQRLFQRPSRPCCTSRWE